MTQQAAPPLTDLARHDMPVSADDLRARVRYHAILLVFATSVLALAAVLEVPHSEQVSLRGIPLPGSCFFRWLTGHPCAGCGLTRCFVSLAHGRVADAWAFHPLGLVLFALFALQAPFRGMQIRRLLQGKPEWQMEWMKPLGWVLIVGFLALWLWRLAF